MHLWWIGSGTDGNLAAPAWDDVVQRLAALEQGAGIVELEVAEPGGGMRSLQVRAQAGAYVLADGARHDDDWLFRIRPPARGPVNGAAGAAASTVSILGDIWDASHVGHSLDAVIAAFRQLHALAAPTAPAWSGMAPAEGPRASAGGLTSVD